MTEETHRATTFEIFFDLVFVFALTRIIALMGEPPKPVALVQGLLVLLLLWISWSAYTWLGNQVRADVGLIRAGTTVAMAALFLAALVIPDAWRSGSGAVDAPLTLALAYIVLRVIHLALFFHVATYDRQLRVQVRLFAIPTILAWIPLTLGAVLGGTAQTLLWAAAFIVDAAGGRISTALSGWQLRSLSHFTERHGLVLIIALGESLISVGAGAGPAVTRLPVLLAALLGFITTVCLWWLYFKSSAPVAGQALASAKHAQRTKTATDAYSLAHIPLIAGVIYLALGIEQVLAHVAHNQSRQTPLDWTSTAALYGGVVLYLAGQAVFLRLTARSTSPAQLVAIGLALLLLPAGRILPALTALALLTAFLVALVSYQRLTQGEQDPAAGRATPA